MRKVAPSLEEGATTLNIPDTVGYAMPNEYRELISQLRAAVPGGNEVIWSAHCHDDLGCATANTLAAIEGGARQVEVTINGIGERAGNTSLEEVVMSIHTLTQIYGVHTGIETTHLFKTSSLVKNYTEI